MRLRYELLHIPRGGGLDIVDLLLEQVHHFNSDEARALKALPAPPPAALKRRLEQCLLLEGPEAEDLRREGWSARIRKDPPPPPDAGANGPWHMAKALPDIVAPVWRAPERWRRLAEAHAAGQTLLRLEGFLADAAAGALREAVAALPFERRENPYVKGFGCDPMPADLPTFLPALTSGALYQLVGAVMNEALPDRIMARAWRLESGDAIVLHNDGVHYRTTISLGLCANWTAARGGAIAFGTPTPRGLRVMERWLPHLGDVLLFRPTATTWHAVEPVTEGVRYTLTTHYVAPEYPG